MKTINIPPALPSPALLIAVCAPQASGQVRADLPAGKVCAEGKEVIHVHAEANDAGVPDRLTNMMQSPVYPIPSLADVTEEALAEVHVFTNGVKGSGPFGFQPGVFDNTPGAQGYTPLRRLNMITWDEGASARELKSASEVLEARDVGELVIEQPGLVINMPFVVWDGGQR